MIKEIKLDKVKDAIKAIKNGEIIIVVDDHNRENEGDFIAAAEKITPQMINFMATHGRGLICSPLTEKRCVELNLNKMVDNSTDPLDTAFTISVDLKGNGIKSGISADDRCKTIKALIKITTPFFSLFISEKILSSPLKDDPVNIPKISLFKKDELILVNIGSSIFHLPFDNAI